MSDSTALTVAMPVYNAMPHLPEAVESILEQSYDEFVFLIVNDGSDDGSEKYLDSIEDPRVEIIHQANRGLGATLNRTLDLCETPLYARMDADDVAKPQRFEKQLRLLREDPALVLVGGQIEFLVEETVVEAPGVPLDHSNIYNSLRGGSAALCHPAVMYRTDVARDVRYRIDGAGQDFDFFLRMAERGAVRNHEDVLLQYRVHTGSLAMENYGKVRKGMAYAFECAERREAGEREPDFEAFCQQWENRSPLKRWVDGLHKLSAQQYRQSIIDRARNRSMRSKIRKLLAGVAQPHRAIRHIHRTFVS